MEKIHKLGRVFWDEKRLIDLSIAYTNHDSWDFQPHISAKGLYGELRLRAPIFPILRKKFSRDAWAEKVVPQF